MPGAEGDGARGQGARCHSEGVAGKTAPQEGRRGWGGDSVIRAVGGVGRRQMEGGEREFQAEEGALC